MVEMRFFNVATATHKKRTSLKKIRPLLLVWVSESLKATTLKVVGVTKRTSLLSITGLTYPPTHPNPNYLLSRKFCNLGEGHTNLQMLESTLAFLIATSRTDANTLVGFLVALRMSLASDIMFPIV